MPRQNLNGEEKSGGKKCKVRKRGCSSSSSSSLVKNYRLKRAFLVGKRRGSSTPMSIWKMMSSNSPLVENHALNGGEVAKELLVSARKLAATLWEINELPSPRVKKDNLEDKMSKIGNFDSSKVLSDAFYNPVLEKMDPFQKGIHRRRALASSQKLLQMDGNLGDANSLDHCLVEVDQTQNHARSPCRHIIGTKNRLKDVYNGLTTSKELCKVMSRIYRVEHQNSTCLSLVSALKFELDRACIHVHKLIDEQRTNRGDIDILLKQFEEEKVLWKIKQEKKIHSAITSIAAELEIEKKLRRQTERMNKKLGKELVEIKESLSSEKRAREILEQVCDELARGVGEDKAEVEELKRQSEKTREEVEKEREMFRLADVLREERVQMKLLEAKYQFEEKNEVVDKLRNDLEVYLKSKKREERGDGSPNYEKIKELEKYLRETLPCSFQYQDNENENSKAVKNADEAEEEDDENDSTDSELHSIELNVDDFRKSFCWNRVAKNESKRNSVDKSKKQSMSSERKVTDGIEWEFTTNKREHSDGINKIGSFEFEPISWKKDAKDEMERYNMIKDLRDHIVSGSRMGSSHDLPSPGQHISREVVSSKDLNSLVCEG